MATDVPMPSVGQKVLVVKLRGGEEPPASTLTALVEKLKQQVGESGSVEIQPATQINDALKDSTFSVCYVGYDSPMTIGSDSLDQLLRATQLGGRICIREPIAVVDNDPSGLRTENRVKSALRLAGFVDITTTSAMEGEQLVCHAEARKPAYEVGTSVALKLPAASGVKNGGAGSVASVAATARQVWTLSANDVLDDEVELLDSDTVLNESDFKKPDPTSLKAVCGEASTKRKACKDCSCGLAERLKEESNGAPSGVAAPPDPTVDPQIKASSCGSCYLGDAFRCAGCPYTGMPAFKPGERVLLAPQADI